MENINEPASPYITYMTTSWEDQDNHLGLTKLELGTLMILQGMATNMTDNHKAMAKVAARLAALGLEAANNYKP